nr:unnamed protein product [Digitaria exilis]
MAAAAFLGASRAAPALLLPSRGLPRRLLVSAASSSSSSGEGAGGVVGFLGLGIMGAPMASNLIKAGCDVTVWNRTKSKCDPLLSLGAKYEPSPAGVASSCDVTFAMLADPQSAAEVACGANGAAEGLAPGKGYVDVSTVDGATSKLIGEHITSTGASFLEAPVSGSKKPAEDGLLIFLTAGNGAAMKLVDLRLALALAESVSQPIPTVAAANELYKAAKSLGLADHDFKAVIEALKAKVENSQK